MNKKVTIKDIARELNIAYSTVSRALNNKGGISEKKRNLILSKARELGYEPNLSARQLRGGNNYTIGLIVPSINRVFFSNIIHGVETEAKLNAYNVIICQSNENMQEETESINTLLRNNVSGILISLSKETVNNETHKEIRNRNIPFVMFDRVFRNLNVNIVINDNFNSAYAVTKHMIEQGYSSILHFTGPLTINIYRERTNGYKKALQDHGLPFRQDYILENVLTREKGFEETRKRLESETVFDAIFSASDFSALGAMMCLQEMGIGIPDEVGVAGFANEPFTDLMQLTTVDQHSIEIGRSATRLLFEEIERGPSGHLKKEVVIKPDIIIRNSTLKKKMD